MPSVTNIVQPVIVQIVPQMNRGGVERGTVEIAEAISARGWKAVVICNGGRMENQLRRAGAEVYTLPVDTKNPLKWPAVRRRLKAVLLSVGADIVHVRSRAPAWIALPLTRAMGIHSISTIHSKFVPQNFVKRIYNQKMLSADGIIAISDYVKSVITSHYSEAVSEKAIQVIHRGVDLDVFDPAKVSQHRIVRLSETLNLPDDGPVVMLPARATEWKGHAPLIEAVARLEAKDVTLLLLGAGDGHSRFIERLRALAIKTGLDGRLRIASGTDDMPAALMLADVVAMPSTVPEPFGRVALEAQAMGRPVVAFKHGGAIESIQEGETGWLAEPNNVEDLARCLQLALKLGPRQRTIWAKRARAHVESAFSTQQMCEKTLEIYADFLQK
ncbi:MAG: glycosyltransferase family 4 protein [Candidatus Puniceispirillaceae bacterium]|jgi:glycosyltransferase involved in cell wall biosynthesis